MCHANGNELLIRPFLVPLPFGRVVPVLWHFLWGGGGNDALTTLTPPAPPPFSPVVTFFFAFSSSTSYFLPHLSFKKTLLSLHHQTHPIPLTKMVVKVGINGFGE